MSQTACCDGVLQKATTVTAALGLESMHHHWGRTDQAQRKGRGASQMDRYIRLEGASNFRDFGGYPTEDGRAVAWHRLYRSDRLSALTAADYATLEARNIRLVCDLRRHAERQADPTRWRGEPGPELWHVPLLEDTARTETQQLMARDESLRRSPARVRDMMIEIYRLIVTEPGALLRLREIFQRLAAAESYPVLIHCAGGKDRTGVTCALLLSLLGVARDDVVADYLLTRDYYRGLLDLQAGGSQVLDSGRYRGWSREALVPVYSVEEAYLAAALDIVDREYGSAAAFLERAVGMAPEQLDSIRAHLLV